MVTRNNSTDVLVTTETDHMSVTSTCQLEQYRRERNNVSVCQ